MSDTCCHPAPKWYRSKLFIAAMIGLLAVVASSFYGPTAMVAHHFGAYVKIAWWAIGLGLIIGGIIDTYLPQTYIEYLLARRKKRTLFTAALLGFLMSACCHGILAVAIALYKKGASVPAVMTFLLASPWANLPLTFMLFGFFGAKAFIIVVLAIVIAIITGFIFQCITPHSETPSNHFENGIWDDIKTRWRNYHFSAAQLKTDFRGILAGFWQLTQMVLWWVLIGMIIASFFGGLIPQEFIAKYLGPTNLGLLGTLGLATILEVCSEGTAPLAFELYAQTGAFGNAFVFLMAGVVTDYTEIGLIWTNINRKTAILLPLFTVPQVMAWGIIINRFLLP